jgi:hypothetical protein
MPVEFLSDEQVAAYGRFTGELPAGELERFFCVRCLVGDPAVRPADDFLRTLGPAGSHYKYL